jgi:dTMP kinase
VLSDRYVDSSVAYQGAGRELGMDRVKQINAPAVGDTMPDMTMFFDTDPMLAIARRGMVAELDRLEREDDRFLQRVYDGYRRLAEAEPNRIRRMDATRSIEEVRAQVIAALMELIGRA